MLNPEEVAKHLENSIGGTDPKSRRDSSSWIMQNETTERYGPLLLHLVTQPSSSPQVKIMAAVCFKNFVKKYWGPAVGAEDDFDDKINQVDRNEIREKIIELMLQSEEKLQLQFAEAITYIGKHDFPDKWTDLFGKLINYSTNFLYIICLPSLIKLTL